MTSEATARAAGTPETGAGAAGTPPGLEALFAAFRREVRALNGQLAEARSERVEQLLEKERLGNRLALLLESLPGAVIVLDGEGIIVECNTRSVELLGRPLIGLTWAEVVDREFGAVHDSGGELRLPDGRWLALSRRPLGSEPGEILLLTDVTETRRLQETAERQSRLSSMGEMTARLAHQIRTPLASALLYVSQMEQSTADEGLTRRFAGRAIAKLRELEQMINDMVVFAGGGRGAAEEFSVARLLADVADAAAPHLGDEADVAVVMAEADLRMSGNRPALAGALGNLVQNALQAAGETARVELGAARTEAGELWLTVTDNGPGVDDALRERIFEPFFTTRRQGTGLGLAVVRSVAAAHGGSVSVENHARDGEGATFLLRLPAAVGQPLLASRTAFAGAGEAAAAAARQHNEFRSQP